jgi:hypothetical protein
MSATVDVGGGTDPLAALLAAQSATLVCGLEIRVARGKGGEMLTSVRGCSSCSEARCC